MCPTKVFLPNNFYLLSVTWNVILKPVQVRLTVTVSGSGDRGLTSEHSGHDELIVKFPETLGVRFGKSGGKTCVPVVAFRGPTVSRPSSRLELQFGGILPAN